LDRNFFENVWEIGRNSCQVSNDKKRDSIQKSSKDSIESYFIARKFDSLKKKIGVSSMSSEKEIVSVFGLEAKLD